MDQTTGAHLFQKCFNYSKKSKNGTVIVKEMVVRQNSAKYKDMLSLERLHLSARGLLNPRLSPNEEILYRKLNIASKLASLFSRTELGRKCLEDGVRSLV